ncbi:MULTISPECIES: transporter substrate-binding domain-containing protein [unclassified Rhizobium]|uniref:transporter substrate-binding domain-containing protein n=1 Tax=unclassified Rhizobium TaxID=2613769 RepID=UPI0007155B76|nr:MULTISPECIES: transporter substrate-binding domain-containing protein [unclassified Rhizobium]KQS89462.1 amino acid ABC transporter substrate-binding protein [Rhizobium sp. Leaf391]KQS94741.1 amino acid ABC transporter substrate-binding protein [Rhizobium sp. Leaf386]KQU01119.1 amino acid ABC transporter substrate-binding protein [Rhizobium sp. Leaf453]
MSKSLQYTLATLISLAALASQAEAGEVFDRVKEKGEVVNALVNDYPPFAFINDKNELDGFDVDVAKAFAEKLGVKLKLETPGWETIIGGRWAGRWDIAITSSTPTEERAKVVNFPVNYYSVPAVLVVNKDEQAIKSVADITGKKVGVGTGSSYEAYVSRKFSIPGQPAISFSFGEVQVVPNDETVNFQNLALGPGVRLDAIVASLGTAQGQIDATGKLKLAGEPLFAEPNAVVTDKGDAEWDAEVKRIITALKDDGTLAKISEKWFKVDITKYAF